MLWIEEQYLVLVEDQNLILEQFKPSIVSEIITVTAALKKLKTRGKWVFL